MSGLVLVTGATGFVGRALIARLIAEGRSVVALVRQWDDHLPKTVEQRVMVPIENLSVDDWCAALTGSETVIHLAGIAHIGPGVPEARYDMVNAQATRLLAQAVHRAGVSRLIFASSIRAQTGAVAAQVLYETSDPQPNDAYGRSKLAAERAIVAADIDYTIIRPVLIVGPEAKGNLNLLLKLARSGIPLPFACLKAKRSLVSLRDVVALLVRALDDPALCRRVLIAADAVPVTVGDMLTALRAGIGLSSRLFCLPESVLRLPFRLMGRQDVWERIGGALVVDPQVLREIGYRSAQNGLEALTALSASATHAQRKME